MSLNPAEIARYQRHLSLAGFGLEAQEKLKHGRVLVIGAGGLGCPALLYLAAAGVGHVSIVDPDRVDVSNLQRQIVYTEADAGELKAEAAARRLKALNPLVQIEPHAVRFNRANALRFVAECDVVVDGTDNFATRYLINDACVLAGKPLVYGAIHGFEGQASVFNWRGGPTYRCLFPEPPEAGTVPNCAEAGVLGVLPGLIGTVQATEAIKLLSGVGEPLSGRLWIWNALRMTSQMLVLAADPHSQEITQLPPDGYGETCAAPLEIEIDVSSLRARLAGSAAQPQLLDVREGWERSQGAISPSAHRPVGEVEANPRAPIDGFDAAREIVVYCASGVRSLRAARALLQTGNYETVRSLKGGYKAWAASAGK
jgi:adenylyltransferase/sulfurtransferase